MIHKHIKGTGVVSTLVGGGVGAAAYFGIMKAGQNLSFLQGRWWAAPTALLVVGHLAKRWSEPTGQAVVGAAGALIGMSYYVQSQGQLNSPSPAQLTGDAGRLPPGATRMPGYIRAGLSGDAGALRGPGAVLRSEAGMLRDG